MVDQGRPALAIFFGDTARENYYHQLIYVILLNSNQDQPVLDVMPSK